MSTITGTGLSIRQPWVELILQGRKTIEVRTWSTSHRGELWLHAGQRVDNQACAKHHISGTGLVLGAIVGAVDVEDCFRFDAQTWHSLRKAHLNIVPFDERYYGWQLRNPRRISPVSYRGTLGLMNVSYRGNPQGRTDA
jgi:activating signal cointegrator 1